MNQDAARRDLPISAKAVIIRQSAVVLLLNERDEWELPGGKLEEGESREFCVVREVAEECALRVEVVAPLGEWIYEEIVPRRSVRIVTFGCRERSSSAGLVSAEHRELRWFPLEEVPALPMPQGYKDSIALWAKMERDATAA